MGLVAAACGSSSDDTTTTAGGGGGATGDPVTIDVILTRPYYIPPGFVEAMLADHNIELIVNVQSNDDILQQLQVRLDAGQDLPDLLGAEDSFLMPAFAESGLVGDHAAFQAEFEAEDPDLYNLLGDLVWTETAGIGASITANFDAFYYNVEWVEEAGVTVPFESYDEVLEAMRALKATRPDSIPLTVQAKAGDGVTTLKTMLAGAGAPFTGAVPDLLSDGGVYTCQWWVDAATEDLTPPDAVAWGEDESRAAFTSGNAGLILDGFTTAGDFNEIPDFDYPAQWSLTPPPSKGGPEGVILAAARTWGIIEGTDHPKEAALVIRAVAETQWLVAQADNGGVPARQSEFIDSAEALEIWPFFNDDLKAAYNGALPQPAGENAGEVEAILEQFFGEIVSGVSSDCSDLTTRYQAELDAA